MLHPEVSCRLTGPKGLRVGRMVDISPVDGAWTRDLGGDGSARVETISRVVRIRDGSGRLYVVRSWSREIKGKKKTRASTIEEPERRVNEKSLMVPSSGTEQYETERIRAT